MLRLRDRDAPHRPAGGGWPPVQPVPRDEPLFADPCVPAHRPQPPRRGHGVPHRPPDGVSRLHGPGAEERGDPAPAAARRRVQHHGSREVAPRARRGTLARGSVRPVATRLRVRALLRLPAGRHQPLVATPRAGQRLCGAAAHRGRGLPPHRRPRRPRDPLRAPPARGGRRSAVLPLLRPGRDARAAPRRPRMDRALPRNLRPGLGALARRGLRPPAGHGNRARGHVAPAAPELDPGMGCALLRRAADARPPAGGVRRIPLAHRRPDRARARARSKRSASSTTRWSCSCPTTAPAARAAHWERSTSIASPSTSPRRWSRTSSGATSSAGCAPIPTTRGAGRGRETPRCGSGSATRGSAARARR